MVNIWDDVCANSLDLIAIYCMCQNITMNPINKYNYCQLIFLTYRKNEFKKIKILYNILVFL